MKLTSIALLGTLALAPRASAHEFIENDDGKLRTIVCESLDNPSYFLTSISYGRENIYVITMRKSDGNVYQDSLTYNLNSMDVEADLHLKVLGGEVKEFTLRCNYLDDECKDVLNEHIITQGLDYVLLSLRNTQEPKKNNYENSKNKKLIWAQK